LIRFTIYLFGEPRLPFKLDELFLAATWLLYLFLPTAINLGFFTEYFVGRWKESLVNAERLEKEKSRVQFDNLKNQLNPHFLFNALTSLNSLIFEDQTLASQFLQQLSKVYRYVLQHKDKKMVNVETELNFIGHYVSLLRTRFKDALVISIQIKDQDRELGIVPVTLQILIENAIKHNVIDLARPLTILITTEDHYLVVANNIQLKRRVEESNKQGLDNLRSLYQYLSDRPVLIEEDVQFKVKVPLL
jgi:two-component system, LytTR family, sensor kinase